MTTGWEPSDFFALAARLSAAGIEEARPPNDDETAGAYLAKLYGWVMDACTRTPVLDEPEQRERPRRVRFNEHLIDHDAEALLQGKTLDPKQVGIGFTYRRGTF